MIKILLFFIGFMFQQLFAQNTFNAFVKDEHTNEPLIGVNVILKDTPLGSASNERGLVEITNIPDGTYEIIFSCIGYRTHSVTLTFPTVDDDVFEILLESEAEELEEISVTSTRGSRLIDDEPTRVEIIAGEEIDEKISMDPSNISMMLNESTGIQVQQTSASSVNSTFRIQGLDGRYTQLLKDGFPLYSGFSGSLSIVQIPPLDLRQIEIIKGSASTLYGGGAIAGLINLVSKEPSKQPELSFLVNITSASGLDLSGYYSQKFEDYGLTFFASRNTQSAYDNNDDNFTDLPETERYSFDPKFYFYFTEYSNLEIGGSFSTEERIGGSINLINGNPDSVFTYTEENLSDRYSAQIKYKLKLSGSELIIKNSFGYFDRTINLPGYSFKGNQLSSFSEASYSWQSENHEWISGLNFLSEDFDDKSSVINELDYSDYALGSFIQNTFDITDKIILESEFRADYNFDYGFFAIPRISLLLKINHNVSSRIGGGLGYKIPSIFNEESEKIFFRNLLPMDKNNLKAERSYGFNFDVNCRTILFEELTFSINQLFFYTRINDPLLIRTSENDSTLSEFHSGVGFVDTKGAETNLRLTYDHIKLFLGYTFIQAENYITEKSGIFPLTPKHKLGIVLIFEEHDNYRIGLEAYYTGKQFLSTGERTTDFWVTGLMLEKKFDYLSLFLNFENFLDTKQSRYGVMYTGLPSNPQFVEIYAPTDGRIINGGIKLKL
jgi:outer membrane receptor for ferrienterochelin and colicins